MSGLDLDYDVAIEFGLKPWPGRTDAVYAPIVPAGVEPKPCAPPEFSKNLTWAMRFARHVLKHPACQGFLLEHDQGGWFVRFSGAEKDFSQMIGVDGSDERIAKAICLCGLELLRANSPRDVSSP